MCASLGGEALVSGFSQGCSRGPWTRGRVLPFLMLWETLESFLGGCFGVGIDNTFKSITPQTELVTSNPSVSVLLESRDGAGGYGMFSSFPHCSAIPWYCFSKTGVQAELDMEYAL